MSKFMEIFAHPTYLLATLSARNLIYIPDKIYLRIKYKKILGKKLNLEEPKTFNEKLQWLKLHDRNPNYTEMVDKYNAKKYVGNIIGKEYIIPTLGVYERFDDIEFEKLPNQFVLKPTQTSGNVFICTDKSKIDYKKLKKKINKWLKRDYYKIHREWPYKNVKSKIIAEKYMVDESGTELKDYKFFCFNGKVKYIQVDFDRFVKHKRNIYDVNWNLTDIQFQYKSDENKKIDKPEKLETMIKLANKLSYGKDFLRVDFYSIKDKIYFGELTFYPEAGFGKFIPDEYDKILGDLLELSIEK